MASIRDRMTVRGVEFALQSLSVVKKSLALKRIIKCMPKILELKQHRAQIAISISNLAQRLTAVIVIYIDK